MIVIDGNHRLSSLLGWRWCDRCGINPVVADPDDIVICQPCEALVAAYELEEPQP